MSAAFIAFVVAAGAAGWIFSKLQQRTGYGNNRSAIRGAAAAGILIFIVAYTVAKMLTH